MENQLTLDARVYDTLQENTSDEKFKYYIHVFHLLDQINRSALLNKFIDIAEVENTLISYLTSDTNKPLDFPLIYERVLGESLHSILDLLGVSVQTDKLYHLVDMVNSILFLETIDTAYINTLYTILNNGEEEPESVFADLVNTIVNSDLDSNGKLEYLNVLEAVDESLLTQLRLYCADRLEEMDMYQNKDIFLLTRLEAIGIENVDLGLFHWFFKNIANDEILIGYSDLYNAFINYYKFIRQEGDLPLEQIIICILDCYLCSKEYKEKIPLSEILEEFTNWDLLDLNDLKLEFLKEGIVKKYQNMELNHDTY